jgi:hypothetical protein
VPILDPFDNPDPSWEKSVARSNIGVVPGKSYKQFSGAVTEGDVIPYKRTQFTNLPDTSWTDSTYQQTFPGGLPQQSGGAGSPVKNIASNVVQKVIGDKVTKIAGQAVKEAFGIGGFTPAAGMPAGAGAGGIVAAGPGMPGFVGGIAPGAGGAFTGAGANAAATVGEMSFAGAPISSAGAPAMAGLGTALGFIGGIAAIAAFSGMGDHSRVKGNIGRLEGQMIQPLQAAMNRGDSHTYLNVGGKGVLVEVKPININKPDPGEMGKGIYSKNGWLHSQGLYAVVDDQGNRTGEYVTPSPGKVGGWPTIVSKNDSQWAPHISYMEKLEQRYEQAKARWASQ